MANKITTETLEAAAAKHGDVPEALLHAYHVQQAGLWSAAGPCPYCYQPEGECYLTCPTQDPYGGDQAAEERDFIPETPADPKAGD